jgi:hypothetical protein
MVVRLVVVVAVVSAAASLALEPFPRRQSRSDWRLEFEERVEGKS